MKETLLSLFLEELALGNGPGISPPERSDLALKRLNELHASKHAGNAL